MSQHHAIMQGRCQEYANAMPLRKASARRYADAMPLRKAGIKNMPMPCHYARPAPEDMPTAACIYSHPKTLGRSPIVFGGVGEVGPTQFFTLALGQPQSVVYSICTAIDSIT
ncbi:hypothetical protein PSHT_02807 [Puccinia striiformis]|uniref:Uncharacterized protein n=2 Tax=Puccinia striiformis TaxID=27350 RepID=A0A2S4VJ55_9BASI|nr:hypothetical protein PSTT_06743 [Puccinia striiformis]POW21043.1 hypothetical protein PSHT_02807 [Puccinia striiformis]